MVWLHTVVGYLVLLLFLIATILAFASLSSRKSAAVPPLLRRIVTGLLDLQILIGIITFIFNARWGSFVLHPIVMLIVVALVHMLTSSRRSVRQQTFGYGIATVLMVVGILVR